MVICKGIPIHTSIQASVTPNQKIINAKQNVFCLWYIIAKALEECYWIDPNKTSYVWIVCNYIIQKLKSSYLLIISLKLIVIINVQHWLTIDPGWGL